MIVLSHEREWQGKGTAVAFGMFDGVHLGHQQLLHEVCRQAQRRGCSSMAYTYSNHPMSIFAPDRIPPQLQTEEEKTESLAAAGIDVALLRAFDYAYSQQSPREFVQVMAEALHPEVAVIGFNFSFGIKGSGKADDMQRLGREFGFETVIVSPVQVNGMTVSSTAVRKALQEGNLREALEMLGHPFLLQGTVVDGKHIGRKIAFPTANLAWPEGKVIPRYGVYLCRAEVEGERYEAVANIGMHPTLPQGDPSIKAFFLKGHPDVYGKHMRLSLLEFVREEHRFDSVEMLQNQIEEDCSYAERRFLELRREQT